MNEESLFAAALELTSAAQRQAFLDKECGGDDRLRQRLVKLLAAEQACGILDRKPEATTLLGVAAPGAPLAAEQPFDERFRLAQKLGEGGMGEVWVADQTDPVQRRVALKVIKPGLDSRPVLARFEAERQALALMDHPNIAKVLDAGETPPAYAGGSPRPYFVMELVQGVPLTTYCDDNKLTLRHRLELLVPVCQGVQHAHQKGVIHRDLKPSNVLVAVYDGQPVPKIIDFGIAKATGPKLTNQTLATALGSVLGTPEYMSPEQAEPDSLDIDTRSDVYALGVLLYEQLTGTTPLRRPGMRDAGLLELLRRIREEEPPPPSTRLATAVELPSVAANRSLEPAKLRGLVRDELDWIVMKCLEKDRTRRYETADGLARDLGRYLRDEPVEASPPGTGYRLRKFARRHKKVLATAAAFVLLLLGGVAVSAWQAVKATSAERQALAERDAKEEALQAEAAQHQLTVAEKQRANEEAAIARAVDDFLRKDLLGQADIRNQTAGTQRNRNLTVRELLDRAAARIDTRFRGQERTEAAVRLTLGRAYQALGEYAAAEKHLERSLALRREKVGLRHLETLHSQNALGALYLDRGRYNEAEPLFEQALEGYRAEQGADHANVLITMHNLATLYLDRGRYDEAESLFLQCLEGLRIARGADDFDTLNTMSGLAGLYNDRQQFQKAAPLYKQVEEAWLAQLGADHPDTLVLKYRLAVHYADQGRYKEAEPLLNQVREMRRVQLGADHPDTLHAVYRLGSLYRDQRRYKESEPLLNEALKGFRARLGDDDLDTLESLSVLACLYLDLGRYDDAEPMLKQVLEGRRVRLSAHHPLTLTSANNLAMVYWFRGQHDQVKPLLEQVLNGFQTNLSEDHPRTLNAMSNLGGYFLQRDQPDKAEPLLERVLAVRRAKLPADHPDTLHVMNELAALNRKQSRHERAEALFGEVLEARRRTLPAGHPATLLSMNNLAVVYRDRGQDDLAEPLLEEVLKTRRVKLPADHPDTLRSMTNLALLYLDRGRHNDAEPLLREAVAGGKRKLTLGHPLTQWFLDSLADLYSRQGKPHLAEPDLRELVAFSRDKDGLDSPAYANLLARLSQNLLEQRKHGEAETLARHCLTIRARKEPDAWTTFHTRSLLGGALLGQEKYAEAQPLLEESYAGLKEREPRIPKDSKACLTRTLGWLVQLHDARGNTDEAARWRKELEARRPSGGGPPR